MKKENHEYLYEIINFWLSNEKYEYYLNSLFQNMPKIFNLKEKPIITIALEKYLKSLMEELINQKSDIVDKNYYLRLFNKLYFSPFYDHKYDAALTEMINNFKVSLKLKKFKSERKIESLENMDRLGKKEDAIGPIYKVTSEELAKNGKYIPIYLHSALRESDRRDLTNENTIIITDNDSNNVNYALSVNYTSEGDINLKFHVLDITSLIEENTPLYKDFVNNNTLSKKVISQLSLKENSLSPCFTFSLYIDNKGKIYDYEMFKSIIKVRNKYDKKMLYTDIRKNDQVSLYAKTYRLLKNYYKTSYEAISFKDIDDTFRHVLGIIIGNQVKNDFPFIYKVQEAPNSKEVYHQVSNLNYYLHYLKDEDYRKVYEIICNKNNTKAHYSTQCLKHYATGKKYQMDILKPFNFTGYSVLQVLKDYYLNNLSISLINAKYEDRFNEIVAYYNKKFYNIEETNKKGYARKRS